MLLREKLPFRQASFLHVGLLLLFLTRETLKIGYLEPKAQEKEYDAFLCQLNVYSARPLLDVIYRNNISYRKMLFFFFTVRVKMDNSKLANWETGTLLKAKVLGGNENISHKREGETCNREFKDASQVFSFTLWEAIAWAKKKK